MKTFKKITFYSYPVLILFSLLLFGCAAKVVNFEQRMLNEADSMFHAGNYENAKLKYTRIRDSGPQSEPARSAQFNLGYINIYYQNPSANPEAALREFKLFAALYPEDFRIGEVNSWIRLIVVMQSFKKGYQDTISKIEQQIKDKDQQLNQARRVNIDIVTESLRTCYEARDSLNRKVNELENVIVDLERKCQQAGR
jgi:outer membrane protein assembly factor BamD (BamD/ComL family)